MALKIHNDLSNQFEQFRPANRHTVRLYVCGPSLTHSVHLGHARLYVLVDTVVRHLKFRGYTVQYALAYRDARALWEIAQDYLQGQESFFENTPEEQVEANIRSFQDAMDALGNLRPNLAPRSTAHIPHIIAWIAGLLQKGLAYEREGHIYFVQQQTEYPAAEGDESNQPQPTEPHLLLWEHAEVNHPQPWASPWGPGFPGPHVACPVLADRYLGPTFDILAGCVDDLSCHQCDLIQAEAHNGVTLARTWLLIGPLTVRGQPMSYALGNYLTVQDALRLYSPEAIRYFILSHPYQEALEFNREAMLAAQHTVDELHKMVRRLRWRLEEILSQRRGDTAPLTSIDPLEEMRQAFLDAMDEGFNTPKALDILAEAVRETEHILKGTYSADETLTLLSTLNRFYRDLATDILAILPEDLVTTEEGRLVDGLMDILVAQYAQYVKRKDWQHADTLRNRLAALGIRIEESSRGFTWHLKP